MDQGGAAALPPAGVIVPDAAWTAGPLVGLRHRIPNVIFTVSPLNASSIDTAPFGTGLPPSSSPLGRFRNRALSWAPRRGTAAHRRGQLGAACLVG